MQKKNLVIYAGFIWCMAFAALTFYWASGGMLGVRSLGGVIYEKQWRARLANNKGEIIN